MKEFGLRDGRVASLAPFPWNGRSWVCTGRYLCCLVLRREWQNDTSVCMHPVMHIMRQYYGGKWKRISTHPMIHTVYLTMPLLGSGKEGMATCQQYTCLQMIAHWRHYWRVLPLSVQFCLNFMKFSPKIAKMIRWHLLDLPQSWKSWICHCSFPSREFYRFSTPKFCANRLIESIGGSKVGAPGTRAPRGQNFFIFIQYSAKICKIIRIRELAHPIRENPGSATGIPFFTNTDLANNLRSRILIGCCLMSSFPLPPN